MEKIKLTLTLYLVTMLFGLLSFSAQAADLIPRIGINVASYYLEEYTAGETADDLAFGPTAGILWALDDRFVDISAEFYSFSTESGIDVDRTELAATYGFKLYQTMYGIVGYQYAQYGDGILDDTIGDSSGPFAGISINNLRMGQDSAHVFSLAIAIQAQSTDYAGDSSTDVAANIKVGYREAGKPHSFSLKYQNFGSDLHAEWITTFNYSYQFAKF